MTNSLLHSTIIPGSAMNVPFLTVGTMMFGLRADEAEAFRIVDAALDYGLNFFDTADMYQYGLSEQILGRAIKGRRDSCVIATKVGYGHNNEGKEEGHSPREIVRALDQSLRDLQTDYVDLYYLHRPDYVTPFEETFEILDALVRSGKIRSIGISNYSAWQSVEIMKLCEDHGWAKPAVAQMIYNPLFRLIEHEYISFCRKYQVYLTIFNPLAGGLLTGKYAGLDDKEKGGRFVNNATYEKRYWSERFFNGMKGLKKIADEAGTTLTHLTLNWIAQTGKVDNILLGPSNADQLRDAVAAGEHPLTEAAMKRINDFLLEWEGTNSSYAR